MPRNKQQEKPPYSESLLREIANDIGTAESELQYLVLQYTKYGRVMTVPEYQSSVNTLVGRIKNAAMRPVAQAYRISERIAAMDDDTYYGTNYWHINLDGEGGIDDLGLHDPMGWRWNCGPECIFLWLARVATSTIKDDVLETFAEYPELAAAVTDTMQRYINDDEAIEMLGYHLSGDNQTWHFGEGFEEVFNTAVTEMFEYYLTHDPGDSSLWDLVQNALADAGVNIFRLADKDLLAAIWNHHWYWDIGLSDHEKEITNGLGRAILDQLDLSDPERFMSDLENVEDYVWEWMRDWIDDEGLGEAYEEFEKAVPEIAVQIAKEYGRDVEEGRESELYAPHPAQERLPL